MTRLTRRNAIASTVLGVAALAGCSALEDDDETVEFDADNLSEVVDDELPTLDPLPVTVSDEHVRAGIDRTESLLETVPDDLTALVPNESVRRDVERDRDDAREHLVVVDEAETNRERLSPLRRARRRAATAAAVVALAREERTRADVFADVDALETQLQQETAFEYTGPDAVTALLVAERAERHFDTTARMLEEIDQRSASTAASDVEIVTEVVDRTEWGRSVLEDGVALLDELEELDGSSSFDDVFGQTATTLLESANEQLDTLPEASVDGAETLFETSVADTPKEIVGPDHLSFARGQYDNAHADLERGHDARALVRAYRIENELLALESLQSFADEGDLERPTDTTPVRSWRERAIDAIETTQAAATHPSLVDRGLDSARARIDNADHSLEQLPSSDPGDRMAVRAIARYAGATAQAKALPAATERLTETLSQ